MAENLKNDLRPIVGFIGEEEFYVLKFPTKLWKIVNDCKTGAIRWGPYGSTILIDYNLFQAEYLECEVPKFKTRNMTSFVRQLNMYGFKKMQTQQRNVMSRYCNIHEFYHDEFRYGRPDLLCYVKRRAIPLKMTRQYIRHSEDRKVSRLDYCRNTFEEVLLRSPEFRRFWRQKPFSLGNCSQGKSIFKTEYKVRVIAADNALIVPEEDQLTVELSSNYEGLIDDTMEGLIKEEDESDSECINECDLTKEDSSEQFALFTGDGYYFLNDNGKPYHLQVRNGFDGANYIIDVGCEEPTEEGEEVKTIISPSSPTIEINNQAPTIHLPESDDLFSCLSSAISILP